MDIIIDGVRQGGTQGLPGVKGDKGIQGEQGADGQDGADGADGSVGDYASFYITTGGATAVAATPVQMVLDKTRENSNTSTYVLASNQVTVNKTGKFLITYDIYFNTGGSNRSEYAHYMRKNGTEITGARCATYQRGYDSGTSASMTLIVDVTSGDYFDVYSVLTDGGATTGYQDNNGTRFTILEL